MPGSKVERQIALVVDSDTQGLQTFCETLEANGFAQENLICCHSIEDAKDLILRDPYIDWIFIEATMKDAKGYSVCSLMSHAKAHNIPVVVTTYISEIGPFYHVIARAHGFLSKPLNPLKLRLILQRYNRVKDMEEQLQLLLTKDCDHQDCDNASTRL